MDLTSKKVVSAIDFLHNLAQNPLQSIPSKHKSILDDIRKSYIPKNGKNANTKTRTTLTGRKRKQNQSNSKSSNDGPRAKRQKIAKKKAPKPKKSDKEENTDNDDDTEEEEEIKESKNKINDHREESDDEKMEKLMENVQLIEESAKERNIGYESPSQFSYFGENDGVFIKESGDLSPLWSRGHPQSENLDNYLDAVSKNYYHPIEAMDASLTLQMKTSKNDNDENENENENEHKILRYSSIDLLLSPLRKRSPMDEWNPREIALFESAMCLKGKRFGKISKIIGTKTCKQCVEFYYFWKQSSHYKIWRSLGGKSNGKQYLKKSKNSGRKLHKKIGEIFEKFHSQQIEQTNFNAISTQNAMHCQYGAMQTAIPQSMNVIGYYPQYAYAQNNNNNGYGYTPWYPAAAAAPNSANAAAYAQYHQYAHTHPQQQQQQCQAPPLQQTDVGNCVNNDKDKSNENVDASSGNMTRIENGKVVAIDLTEEGSSSNNGSKSPKDGMKKNRDEKTDEKTREEMNDDETMSHDDDDDDI